MSDEASPLDFDPGEQGQCRRRAAIGRLGLGWPRAEPDNWFL